VALAAEEAEHSPAVSSLAVHHPTAVAAAVDPTVDAAAAAVVVVAAVLAVARKIADVRVERRDCIGNAEQGCRPKRRSGMVGIDDPVLGLRKIGKIHDAGEEVVDSYSMGRRCTTVGATCKGAGLVQW
jgi:hypothetical protein